MMMDHSRSQQCRNSNAVSGRPPIGQNNDPILRFYRRCRFTANVVEVSQIARDASLLGERKVDCLDRPDGIDLDACIRIYPRTSEPDPRADGYR